jgi:hypothetical protein
MCIRDYFKCIFNRILTVQTTTKNLHNISQQKIEFFYLNLNSILIRKNEAWFYDSAYKNKVYGVMSKVYGCKVTKQLNNLSV